MRIPAFQLLPVKKPSIPHQSDPLYFGNAQADDATLSPEKRKLLGKRMGLLADIYEAAGFNRENGIESIRLRETSGYGLREGEKVIRLQMSSLEAYRKTVEALKRKGKFLLMLSSHDLGTRNRTLDYDPWELYYYQGAKVLMTKKREWY
jgi:hypothetical protein